MNKIYVGLLCLSLAMPSLARLRVVEEFLFQGMVNPETAASCKDLTLDTPYHIPYSETKLRIGIFNPPMPYHPIATLISGTHTCKQLKHILSSNDAFIEGKIVIMESYASWLGKCRLYTQQLAYVDFIGFDDGNMSGLHILNIEDADEAFCET